MRQSYSVGIYSWARRIEEWAKSGSMVAAYSSLLATRSTPSEKEPSGILITMVPPSSAASSSYAWCRSISPYLLAGHSPRSFRPDTSSLRHHHGHHQRAAIEEVLHEGAETQHGQAVDAGDQEIDRDNRPQRVEASRLDAGRAKEGGGESRKSRKCRNSDWRIRWCRCRGCRRWRPHQARDHEGRQAASARRRRRLAGHLAAAAGEQQVLAKGGVIEHVPDNDRQRRSRSRRRSESRQSAG